MGRWYVKSQLDLEADKALAAYRLSIGLPPYPTPEKSEQLVKAGEWIDTLAAWEWFVTVTFAPLVRRWSNRAGLAAVEPYIPEANHRSPVRRRDFAERLASHSPSPGYVSRFFTEWIRKLELELSSRIDYYVGYEAGRLSGANHFHALLSTPGRELSDARRDQHWKWLYDHAGRSLVLPFIPSKGAGWYLAAAYVGKRPLGWDVRVGNRMLIEHRPAKGRGQDPIPSAPLGRDFFHMTLPRWHR